MLKSKRMSELWDISRFAKPKRWHYDSDDGYGHADAHLNDNGDNVEWDDYKALYEHAHRLSLEVQRLTVALQTCDRIIKPFMDKARIDSER